VADDRTLAFLEELERADGEAAAMLTELEGFATQVEELRRRAVELEAFLIRLPAERNRRREASDEARRQVEAARADLEGAEGDLAAAVLTGDDRRVTTAERRVVRARDALHMAERGAAEAESLRESLEAEARDAGAESAELSGRALRLAEELRARPRLAETSGDFRAGGLDAIAEWTAGARAALFVATGSLAAERDALIRQANELGALVVGEQVAGGSAAEVARRIRRAG
jgi:chromosome segregation ATPase